MALVIAFTASTFFFLLAVGWSLGSFWLGARTIASKAQRSSRMIPWMVVAVQLAWMVFAAFLGASGFLSNWDALPPRLPFLPLGCLIVFILIGRTGFVRQGLKHVSIVGPILFQSMRILVESGFWWLHCEGQAPVQVTWKGVNHDLWAGISAPVMAMAVYLRWIRVDRAAGMLTVLVWNLLGLGLLMSAIFSIASSVPGPIFLGWSTGSFPSIVCRFLI
jgi:hypothetical protein